MLRTSILRHEPAPGGLPAHFDWLLEHAPGTGEEVRAVPTFRLHRRPDRLEVGESTELQRIDDHRGRWLGRDEHRTVRLDPPLGEATPVRTGEIRASLRRTDGVMESTVRWSQSGSDATYRIEPITGDLLLVTRTSIPARHSSGASAE